MTPEKNAPPRMKLADFEGRQVRLRKMIETTGGNVFAVGLLMVVYSIHRGRLCLQDADGRFLRQVNRYDVILTRGNPDVLQEWASLPTEEREAVIAKLENRASDTANALGLAAFARARLIAAAVLRGDLETTTAKLVKKPRRPRATTS